MSFRDALRKVLFDRDISLVTLAKDSEISYSTIKSYVAKNPSSRRIPSVAHLFAICKALGLSPDTFIECEDLNLHPRKPEDSD